MTYTEQVGCQPLWAVHSSVVEPFAYITQWGDAFQVDDVEDGPLGSRRTLAEAVALAEQHNTAAAEREAAHTERVNAIIAAMDAA